jgi:hypothetical protein
MRSRRRIGIALATWVVVLFVAGAVWIAVNPPKAEPPAERVPEAEVVSSRQAGYYACFDLPPTASRLTPRQRRSFLARALPQADQAAALEGCNLALRR